MLWFEILNEPVREKNTSHLIPEPCWCWSHIGNFKICEIFLKKINVFNHIPALFQSIYGRSRVMWLTHRITHLMHYPVHKILFSNHLCSSTSNSHWSIAFLISWHCTFNLGQKAQSELISYWLGLWWDFDTWLSTWNMSNNSWLGPQGLPIMVWPGLHLHFRNQDSPGLVRKMIQVENSKPYWHCVLWQYE